MNIFYKRILNLTVGHSFFKDGVDRFVRLYPSSATEKLLKNGKMLFKRLPNGVTVLYQTLDDELTPFVELSKDQHFVFAVKTENKAGLLNITDLDESTSRKFGTGNIMYFTNNPANASHNKNNPELLSQEILDSLRGKLFTYQFKITGNPASVKIKVTDADGNPVSIGKDADGNALPAVISLKISSSGVFESQVDLREYQSGRYQITILNSDETTTLKTEEIYVDDQLEKENILGIIDLVYNSITGNLYGETEEYKLNFNNSFSYWKYYIINKSRNINFLTDSLLIDDNGSLNGSPYEINDFERVFAGILLTAKTTGVSGNDITLEYSDGGDYPAVNLSGQTLANGTASVKASGFVTIINNEITGYTIRIGGVDFAEGTDFSKGTTSADTAESLISAVNGNGSVQVTASLLEYDLLVNDLKALVFSSQQMIPFYEIPKLKLELRKVSDNQTIVANLPNPSHSGIKKYFAGRTESEVYVFI